MVHIRPNNELTGEKKSRSNKIDGEQNSVQNRILHKLLFIIISRQVCRWELECTPPRILEESLITWQDSNWNNAYVLVDVYSLPHSTILIWFYAVDKLNTDEENKKTLQTKINLHGNKDDTEKSVQNDSS